MKSFRFERFYLDLKKDEVIVEISIEESRRSWRIKRYTFEVDGNTINVDEYINRVENQMKEDGYKLQEH